MQETVQMTAADTMAADHTAETAAVPEQNETNHLNETDRLTGTDKLTETDKLIDTDKLTKADEMTGTDRLMAEHAAKLRQVRIDGEVRYMLAKMGAKNPALAAKALDLSGVEADENGVTGVEESVKQLMASDPYLFGIHMPQSGGEHSSGGVHGAARRDPNGMSDKEYYAMVMGKK